jgi:hypothetical protein
MNLSADTSLNKDSRQADTSPRQDASELTLDSGFRVEVARDGLLHLSHADDRATSSEVFALGGFRTQSDALEALTGWSA